MLKQKKSNPNNKSSNRHFGFTLLEVMIGILILAIVSLSLYELIKFTLNVLWESKTKITATQLANQKIEMARDFDYIDVGTTNGIPTGIIPAAEIITRNGIDYTVTTDIQYVDDPFDGTIGGDPNDILNTDYKKMRVQVSWPYRLTHKPVTLITNIAPIGLESEASGGTLKILVYNANGEPVPQANVSIQNSLVIPNININTLTDNQGYVVLPGSPESTEGYEIIVTKNGYSTDQTHNATPELPTPEKPPASVFENQTTNISFAIDELSNLTVGTVVNTYEDWWNNAWNFRQPVYIYGPASTQYNYTVAINIAYDSDMQNDFDDIRFTDQSGAELNYWRESYTDMAQAIFWVKIMAIPNGITPIFMYYGNAQADTTSNGPSAFLFFDDFETYGVGSIIDGQGIWYTDDGLNSYAVVNENCYSGSHCLKSHDVSSKAAIVNQTYDGNVLLNYRAKLTDKGNQTTSDFNMTVYESPSNGGNWDRMQHRGLISQTNWGQTIKNINDDTGRQININAWQQFKIGYYNNNRLDIWIDDYYLAHNIQTYVNNINYFYIYNDENDRGYYDLIYIRKYSPPEPYVYGFGIEDGRPDGASTYLANIPFIMAGGKIIGYDANEQPVYKYTAVYSTDYNGLIYIENLEWDSYTFTLPEDSSYNIGETVPIQPLNLMPATTSLITLGLNPKSSHAALIIVKDIDENPLANATVNISAPSQGLNEEKTTNESGQVFFDNWAAAETTLQITLIDYEIYLDTFDLYGYHIEQVIMIAP